MRCNNSKSRVGTGRAVIGVSSDVGFNPQGGHKLLNCRKDRRFRSFSVATKGHETFSVI
jgi:hypothetical protein